nr:MAG TPA: hypothetical protein [Bacteriophage sp.]
MIRRTQRLIKPFSLFYPPFIFYGRKKHRLNPIKNPLTPIFKKIGGNRIKRIK